MRVFMTLLTDSVRLLRARALFWVTLWISVFVALVFLSIGFTPTGVSIFFGLKEIKNEVVREGSAFVEPFYLGLLFSNIIVAFWFSWAAVILGLISCASIFPDFMSEGSIGIAVSKPVSRLTLFICKYTGALLFVAVQIGLFCLIVFFAIRWRLGVWNFSIFWAVPIVTLVFSYIYSVVVLVAVKSRSVLAAILAGIGIWLCSSMGQWTEGKLYENIASTSAPGSTVGADADLVKLHESSVLVMAFLPKTGQTMRVMDRLIVLGGEKGISQARMAHTMGEGEEEGARIDRKESRNSTFYIIGTSLAFEAVVLALAAWMFCRRDY